MGVCVLLPQLAEAIPVEGSGVTLPLDLRVIAARCKNAYYAPKKFSAVQLAYSEPRCRVLVFRTFNLPIITTFNKNHADSTFFVHRHRPLGGHWLWRPHGCKARTPKSTTPTLPRCQGQHPREKLRCRFTLCIESDDSWVKNAKVLTQRLCSCCTGDQPSRGVQFACDAQLRGVRQCSFVYCPLRRQVIRRSRVAARWRANLLRCVPPLVCSCSHSRSKFLTGFAVSRVFAFRNLRDWSSQVSLAENHLICTKYITDSL